MKQPAADPPTPPKTVVIPPEIGRTLYFYTGNINCQENQHE
jgi:hypothetical protein